MMLSVIKLLMSNSEHHKVVCTATTEVQAESCGKCVSRWGIQTKHFGAQLLWKLAVQIVSVSASAPSGASRIRVEL